MKCFSHPETHAVGICKWCSKGICITCAFDTGAGLACNETCVKAVKNIATLINVNTSAVSLQKKARFLAPMYLIIMGLFFVLAPIVSGRQFQLTSFTTLFGALFVVFGVVVAWIKNGYDRVLRQSAQQSATPDAGTSGPRR